MQRISWILEKSQELAQEYPPSNRLKLFAFKHCALGPPLATSCPPFDAFGQPSDARGATKDSSGFYMARSSDTDAIMSILSWSRFAQSLSGRHRLSGYDWRHIVDTVLAMSSSSSVKADWLFCRKGQDHLWTIGSCDAGLQITGCISFNQPITDRESGPSRYSNPVLEIYGDEGFKGLKLHVGGETKVTDCTACVSGRRSTNKPFIHFVFEDVRAAIVMFALPDNLAARKTSIQLMSAADGGEAYTEVEWVEADVPVTREQGIKVPATSEDPNNDLCT